MNNEELAYIEARTKIQAAFTCIHEMMPLYAEIMRRTILTYLTSHYPHLLIEVVVSLRNTTRVDQFDYSVHFEFRYPLEMGSPQQFDSITDEVWDYLHTLGIPSLAITHDTAPGTSGDDRQAQGIPGEDHPVGVERFLAPTWQDGHTPDPGEEGHTAVTRDTTHTVLDVDRASSDTSRYGHDR